MESGRWEGKIVVGFETGTSPLALAMRRFGRRLVERGYTRATQEAYLCRARGFARFAATQRLELCDLRDDDVEAFIRADTEGRQWHDGGSAARRDRRNPLQKFLAMLREEGVAPPAAPVVEVLGPRLSDYLTFARGHLGLADGTLRRRRRIVGRFLDEVGARTDADLRSIAVEQIDAHLISESHRLSKESMGSVSTSLRGFLGFLYIRGVLPKDLRPYVPRPRLYRLAHMPRALAWADVQRTLAMIDRQTRIGCRDHAMLALIAYCGLRAGDVAALRLPDLDWRRDVIHARRPKTRSHEAVPMIDVVGEAMVAYVRQRPRVRHDAVFLTVNAPPRPLAAGRISTRAAAYMRRAGVQAKSFGAHALRHSLAVELLRQGRSLKEIGEVLGHTHPQSTYLYAKADVEQLRHVALDLDDVLPTAFPSWEIDAPRLREVALDIKPVLPEEPSVDALRELTLDVGTVLA